jgi:copper homeostasis protein
MKLEVCTGNIETVRYAGKLKIDRIELCSALSIGGLTPSIGLIEAAVKMQQPEIHVMIRHRAGNFVYTDKEITIMEKDIKMAIQSGARGVVFGCLTEDNRIALTQTKFLTRIVKEKGLEVTFHRAFDFVKDPMKHLELLIELGVDRILTSGGKNTAIEAVDEITQLTKAAKNRIEIMAGSGVNAENATSFLTTGVSALHFSGDSHNITENDFGMGTNAQTNKQKIDAMSKLF